MSNQSNQLSQLSKLQIVKSLEELSDSRQLSNSQSKQLFDQYISNLSAESLLLSEIEHVLTQRSNILDQILTLEGVGPFKVNGRVFSIIKRYGKCHERELKEREIKVVA